MSDINLLQTQSNIHAIKATSQKWLLRIVTLVLVVALLMYGYLMFMSWNNSKKIKIVQDQINQVKSELDANKQRSELVTRQGQLKQVNELLAKHQYWSLFLPELARVSLASSQYTNIDLDQNGDLLLSVSFPSYQDAEKYLQVYDLPEYHKYFSNVKVLALSKLQQDNSLKVLMRLGLTLNPELLKNKDGSN